MTCLTLHQVVLVGVVAVLKPAIIVHHGEEPSRPPGNPWPPLIRR